MKYLLKSLVITILILFSSGCASLLFEQKDQLAMGSRYSELERISEAENKDISSAKSVDLIGHCNTYSKLKKYNKLFACLEQLETTIKKGDKIITHYSIVSFSYPQNITVIPYLLEAEAYIDLGAYDKAIASAKKAYELLPTVEWSLKDSYYSWELHCRVRSLGILALAYALKGDKNNASQYVVQLEHEKTGYIAKYRDVDDLNYNLNRLIEADNQRVEEIRKKSIDRVRQMFTLNLMVDKYLQLYNQPQYQ